MHTPVFDKGLEVQGEAHAQRQQRRVFLQHFGQDFEIGLTVFVGKLSGGQLHLVDVRKNTLKKLTTWHQLMKTNLKM